MALDMKVRTQILASLTSAYDLATGTFPLNVDKTIRMPTGVAAGQADRLHQDTNTLAASGTVNVDLAGSLTDVFGQPLTFVKLKGIYVFAYATNVNNVNVIREGTNGAPLFLALGDGIPVGPGGEFLWVAPAAGVTVTPGTGDLLTFTNSGAGTSVTYDFVLWGTSA